MNFQPSPANSQTLISFLSSFSFFAAALSIGLVDSLDGYVLNKGFPVRTRKEKGTLVQDFDSIPSPFICPTNVSVDLKEAFDILHIRFEFVDWRYHTLTPFFVCLTAVMLKPNTAVLII